MPEYFIIAFISRNWEMFQRVPHYTAISRFTKVLCVELPLTVFDTVFRPSKIWRQRSKLRHRLRRVNDNLFVYTPVAVAPFGLSYRSRSLSKLNRYFITRQVRKVICEFNIDRYVSIIHAPHLSCLSDILHPIARIYEVTDERSVTEKCPNLNKLNHAERLIMGLERKLLGNVDIVFVTAKSLYERKHLYNKKTYFIPNGVDLDFFMSSNDKVLGDIEAIPHPRIGYVGHINTFLDFEWLHYCAAEHPDWSFVFVGNFDDKKVLDRNADFVLFAKRNNVFMLGWKEYEDLPAYMNKMDVLVIPRKHCDYSENSNPNKIYQYASTGKPIVSSKFSSVEPFDGPIYIAKDKLTFKSHIERALCENDTKLIDRRVEIARKNDLTLRARDKMQILHAYMAKKV